MVTLQRVAEIAGVHVGTVAVILNGAKGNTRVGAATRAKVLQAAAKAGYVRNESASRLKTGRSNAVGFIGGDLRNPFFAELSARLEAELEKRSLRLIISHISASLGQSVEEKIEHFRRETVRRIIYWEEGDSSLSNQARSELKLLPIGFATRARPGIWLDLKHAIHLSVTFLVKKGLRQFGFYAPQERLESPSVVLRREIFLSECRRLRLPSPVCLTYGGESWNIEAAASSAGAVLARQASVDAFFGFNDVAALGLLIKRNRSARKPLIVCFDGTAQTRCWPGPTLVLDLQIRELARRAVAIALGEMSLKSIGARSGWLRPTLCP